MNPYQNTPYGFWGYHPHLSTPCPMIAKLDAWSKARQGRERPDRQSIVTWLRKRDVALRSRDPIRATAAASFANAIARCEDRILPPE